MPLYNIRYMLQATRYILHATRYMLHDYITQYMLVLCMNVRSYVSLQRVAHSRVKVLSSSPGALIDLPWRTTFASVPCMGRPRGVRVGKHAKGARMVHAQSTCKYAR